MKKTALILIVTVGAALVAWLLWRPTDEKKIVANLDKLAAYCSSPQKQTPMEIIASAASIARLCNDPTMVTIHSLNINRPLASKEISDHVLMLKRRLPPAGCSFRDSRVDVTGPTSAEVITTLFLEGRQQGSKFTDAYEMDISLEKNQGKWLFSSFRIVEFVQK
ncbi:hypothetical protein [Desulforhopalus singaporensis]|uniref:SnoaL-like domain-containing protein n=1 Tax=Desulforhopalus singaporensis TaxID=91360 RepID=A0A1H0TDB8_9BACT|nr:hypothetical protein [Desulforhopalus singaporensis]SDP51618.1 hypothetical protein SAMN05660330_03020 [Desulforhopalus singaporensis]